VHRILLGELLALARSTRAVEDPIIRQQLAQVFMEVEMTKLHNWRTLTQLRRHGKPGPESSLVKLFWTEMSQRLHDTAMQVLGVHGQYWSDEPCAIAHRNIIAQRVLGLPR
jgi:alkylation response protein AidB-like acyl-CoA dehydrogenase